MIHSHTLTIKKLILGLCCGIFIITVAGCTSENPLDDRSSSTDSSSSTNSSDSLQSAEGIDKYNVYIDYYNKSNGIYEDVDKYINSVNKDTAKPTDGDEAAIYSNLPTVDRLIEELTKVSSEDPSFGTLDEETKQLVVVLAQLKKDRQAIYDYYETKEYLSDKYAKVKQLHTALLKSYDDFSNIDGKVYDQITEVTKKVTDLELKRMKDEGLEISYTKKLFIGACRELVNYTLDYDVTTMKKMDTQKVSTMVDNISKTFNDYQAKAADKSLLKKEFDDENSTDLSWFNSAAKDYVAQSRTLLLLLTDNEKYKDVMHTWDFHNGIIISDGQPEKLGEIFDDLISKNNSI